MLITFYSNSQDTLFSIDYPQGIISENWSKSTSGRWFLVRPIAFPYVQLKIPKIRMLSIHFIDGKQLSFVHEPNKKPVLKTDKRTGKIVYSGAFVVDSLSRDEVIRNLALFQVKNSEIKRMKSGNADSLRYIVKKELYPRSEQKKLRRVFYDFDLKITEDSVYYKLSHFLDVNYEIVDFFDWENKNDWDRLRLGVRFLSEQYARNFYSIDYWKDLDESIQEVILNLENIVLGQEGYLTNEYITREELDKLEVDDTLFNDKLVTINSFEKKINFVREERENLHYLERINDSVYKRVIPKREVYLLQKKNQKPVVYTHRKIRRFGDYFVLDRNGGYIGLNIGIGMAKWKVELFKDSISNKSTSTTFAIGFEFGNRFYFKSSSFKFAQGIHIGGRIDVLMDGNTGVFMPTFLIGYTSVLKLNTFEAVEFSANIGPMFFIDDLSLGFYVPIPVPVANLAVHEGFTSNFSVKYRYKHLYFGMDCLYGVGRSGGLNYGSAERGAFALSIGKVF